MFTSELKSIHQTKMNKLFALILPTIHCTIHQKVLVAVFTEKKIKIKISHVLYDIGTVKID